MPNGDDKVANALPAWLRTIATFGLGTFLTLFLLGAIPGMQSPLDRLSNESVATRERLVSAESRIAQFEATLGETRAELARLNRKLDVVLYRLPRRSGENEYNDYSGGMPAAPPAAAKSPTNFGRRPDFVPPVGETH